MSTVANESILSKIQQLLAIASEGSGASENEAFLAAQQAQRLMIKHAIDEAEVLASRGHQVDEKPIVYEFYLQGASATFLEKYHLLVMIAEVNRCHAFFFSKTSRYYTRTGKIAKRQGSLTGKVQLVGYKSDVESVELLFNVMQLQAMNEIQKEYDRLFRDYGTGWASYRRGFYQGYTVRLGERLREANRQILEDVGSGKELVLVSRQEKVDQFVDDMNIKTAKMAKRDSDIYGYISGKSAADRADIGNKKIATKKEIGS